MKEKNGLSAWQLTMMGLGTVVGGSFFLGSSIAIRAAGPSIVLAFIIGGLIAYCILTALSEMATASPHPGSFRTYAEEMYGPYMGFIVGWVYWTGLVLAMSSEATAASLFINSWIPFLSVQTLTVLIVVIITLLNLFGAQILSHLESSLAAIKLLAVVGFILIAVLLIGGLLPGRSPVGIGALAGAPLLPNGIGGLAGSMLIVLFTYSGFEIIGLASSETREPHKTIPRAIRMTIISLLVLYLSVMVLLLPLVPTGQLSPGTSPMVTALTVRGLGSIAGVMNFVLVTAILSTMLASTFGLGRMLRSLADNGQAPAFLIDKHDVPLRGILFSGLVMLAAVSLSYLVPQQIYLFLVSSGGFSLLLAYLVIMITHLRFRKLRGCPPSGRCQLSGYPYTTWFAIISLVVAMASMPLIPGQGPGLYAGLLLLIFYSVVFLVAYHRTREPLPAVAKLLLNDSGKENSESKPPQQERD
ncbi:MAG: amino acid permease [Syntrophomonadaceae bacterium]